MRESQRVEFEAVEGVADHGRRSERPSDRPIHWRRSSRRNHGPTRLELDRREVPLVRPLHRRERDREVLDRQPGRVENRDLGVGVAAGGVACEDSAAGAELASANPRAEPPCGATVGCRAVLAATNRPAPRRSDRAEQRLDDCLYLPAEANEHSKETREAAYRHGAETRRMLDEEAAQRRAEGARRSPDPPYCRAEGRNIETEALQRKKALVQEAGRSEVRVCSSRWATSAG